ncbi:hypothetical protein KDQ40_18300 (plasmid) [Haloarcula marismortui ATCC 33800]|uniref:DUF7979 domain-containing protein n=1 Tax=Haloarcula marismortui ATCC 33800 TaxID=662476 RepID=M0JFU4_9EURY|nr:hypothetical protein C436_20933 [Haloarcula sinaiiensis ATCC 33800]QUJ73930.1 hypothetical protein KDQ40_18300 [Haloarcula sinaiiensis ATCC 33800]
MGTKSTNRFSGWALIIFAVAVLIISGLLIGAPSEPTNKAYTTETNESQVSPDDEVVRYNDLSAAGQDVFDQALRADGIATVNSSPPDFDYPDDTMDYTYVERSGTIYTIGTGSNPCRVCAFVEPLGIVVGLAGVILLLSGVYRLISRETDAT